VFEHEIVTVSGILLGDLNCFSGVKETMFISGKCEEIFLEKNY